MSFLLLPVWAVLAGVAVLAAGVFVLQVLRVRQKRVSLASAPLWAQVLRAAPLRVFRERFERWLAYALILAICTLLWLAGARPELAPARDQAFHVFYLDASAALSARGDFNAAKRALLADVRATDPARRMVLLGDDPATLLLRPGENVALLARRLDGVRAAPRPSAVRDFLGHPERIAPEPAVIHYYGNWGAVAPVQSSVAQGAVILGYLAPPVRDNRGVTALGAAPAGSGAWGWADIYIEAIDADGRSIAPSDLRVVLGDEELSLADAVADGGGLRLRDIKADGRTLTVALRRGDAFAADDQASLVLGDLRPVRVALSPGTPAAIRSLVRLDSALAEGTLAEAAVVVRRANEAFGSDKPALVLAPAESQPAFVFTYQDEANAEDLTEALEDLGVARLDVAALAARTGRPVSIETDVGPTRQAAFWSVLYDPQAGFASAAQMPVFTSRVLRWLADPAPWIPYAAAGEALADQAALHGLGRDPDLAGRRLGGQFHLGAAGRGEGDRPIAVSFTDRATTRSVAVPAPQTVAVRRIGGVSVDLFFILLVLAAGSLLLLEWRLHHRGQMA